MSFLSPAVSPRPQRRAALAAERAAREAEMEAALAAERAAMEDGVQQVPKARGGRASTTVFLTSTLLTSVSLTGVSLTSVFWEVPF